MMYVFLQAARAVLQNQQQITQMLADLNRLVFLSSYDTGCSRKPLCLCLFCTFSVFCLTPAPGQRWTVIGRESGQPIAQVDFTLLVFRFVIKICTLWI